MTSPSYAYFSQDYSGFRPANRELVEVYERGAIFAIPANTTVSMELMSMMTASLIHARAQANKQGAGRRLQHRHMDTGHLSAVADTAKEGVPGAQERQAVKVLKARALRVIPLDNIDVDPKYAALFNDEGKLLPVSKTVEFEVRNPHPELVKILSGGSISIDHRSGCASSRNRPCTCEYIGQWDNK